MLQQKTTVIDLNWLSSCGDILQLPIRRRTANEYRTNSVFANPRFHSKASIQNLRQSLRWQLSSQIVLMFRSLSDNGFCPANLSRKSKGYRNLFKSFAPKTLSVWLSWKSFSQQFSQCQRKKRLANLSRLRTHSNQKSQTPLRRRRLRYYIENTVYALDATVIDLCLSLFPWAQHRKHKSAVKLHTLMDLKGSIPTFAHITGGAVHEITVFREMLLEPSAIYIMDKGYTNFTTLYSFSKSHCFFVIRAKKNTVYYRKCSRSIDKSTGLRRDQTIKLTGPKTSKLYPIPLRRITFRDDDQNRTFVFLTNNFQLDALTVCQLYKLRWQIELFFKWIKQHLRIKSFFGTSINAVKTQVWIAISVYVLVAIIKKELKLERSLHKILQILSILIFEKTSLRQALMGNHCNFKEQVNNNQLFLFDL